MFIYKDRETPFKKPGDTDKNGPREICKSPKGSRTDDKDVNSVKPEIKNNRRTHISLG
jgi:hypothetical protein